MQCLKEVMTEVYKEQTVFSLNTLWPETGERGLEKALCNNHLIYRLIIENTPEG